MNQPNRRQRRTVERRVLAAARTEGCRCRPVLIPDALPPLPGVSDGPGGWLQHEIGCPLGDLVDRRAAAGLLGVLFVPGLSNCERKP